MFRVKSVPLIKMNYILDHVVAIKCGVLFLQLRRKKREIDREKKPVDGIS